MEQLRFDGKVVIVTGAGAGLGRTYALLFGERGAQVVVNDLGGARDGGGKSSAAADSVVNEITMKGGIAVADYNSVVEGEKIVETALNNFGRIDVVVNNAGILRDRSFARLKTSDWDVIHDVHLKGAFKVSQAAWPHMKKQNYGRLIFTSSNSGLYGNFGQANYSAAKSGLVGLSHTLAIEGRKNNIHSNVIVPTAASRLTQDILPPDLYDQLKPELIAPVVIWLCHEDCPDSGSVIESAAGWAAKYFLVRNPGSLLRRKITDSVTPEAVRAHWGEITCSNDLTAIPLNSIEEATASLMTQLEKLSVPHSEEPQAPFSFTSKDCILYSLAIGARSSNLDDLRFLYENHEEFSAFPTMAIIPGQMAAMTSELLMTAIPGKTFDLSNVLHGEQYLEIFKPLPTEGTLHSSTKIVEVLDKGRNAVIVVGVETFNSDQEIMSRIEMAVFVVNGGGFGGPREQVASVKTLDPPNTPPTRVVRMTTHENQAALYRLSGDTNPLHIDPNFAALGGFSRPIIHGLCTLGFSAKAVLSEFGGNDPAAFKSIKVRFSKPLYPGDTLEVKMWKVKNRIFFETLSVESGEKVITGAYIDLNFTVNRTSSLSDESKTKWRNTEGFFHHVVKNIRAKPLLAEGLIGVFQFVVEEEGEAQAVWTVDLEHGEIYLGEPKNAPRADAVLIFDKANMFKIVLGTMDPIQALENGLIRYQGDHNLTKKMCEFMALRCSY